MKKAAATIGVLAMLAISTLTAQAQPISQSGKCIRLNKAWSEDWSPGVVRPESGNGGGTNLFTQLGISSRKCAQLKVESLIWGAQVLPVEWVAGNERGSAIRLKRGDVFLVIGRFTKGDPAVRPEPAIAEYIRTQPAMEGWLFYSIGKKRFALPIHRFEKKSSEELNR